MLWLAHTLSKPSSMATLARSLACPDRVSVFLPPQILITENDLATQDYPLLADSYYVSSCFFLIL